MFAKLDGLQSFMVRVSYMEIYKEEIRDLLKPGQTKKLKIKEDPKSGVYVDDLSFEVVKNADELLNLITKGA